MATIKPRDCRRDNHRTARTHRHRRRAARRGAGDRHASAAGHADHRAAQLAAERRAAERQRAADRIRRHRSDHHRAVQRGGGTGRARQNASKTVLLSTVPKQAPKAVDRGLLIERVNNDLLVIVRNTPVVSAPLDQVLSPACQRLTFTAHADRVTGEFVGLVQGPQCRRSRRAAARRTQRLRLPAADRRRLHRSGRARAAGPGVLGDPRLPLQHARRRC